MPPGLRYLPGVLTPDECREHLAGLIAETPWEDHTFTIFGRTVAMPRRIQMYGPHGYDYSGVQHPPRPLTPRLHLLRQRVEEVLALPFNSVLCNLYRDGQDSMGWHRDDDYPHGGQPVVASLSLGAVRRFRLRPRKRRDRPADGSASVGIDLEDGSLVVLAGAVRTDWVHAVSRTSRPVGPRVNLTFRHMTGP